MGIVMEKNEPLGVEKPNIYSKMQIPHQSV